MTIIRDNILVRSTATISPTVVGEPARRAAPDSTTEPRIELRQPAGVGTSIDGGWWPHSLDLVAELPALLAAVEAAGYDEVRRVSYSFGGWDRQPPHKVQILNRVVKLGGFASQDAAEISLVDGSGWKHVTIAVVPPNTDPTVARCALALAGTDGDRRHAREILEIAARVSPAHSGDAGCVDLLAASGWESEGGHLAR